METYGWLFGGHWVNSKGKPTPATADDIKALEWEQSFYKKFGAQNVSNFISSAGAYLTGGDPFESGKTAMMFDGPWTEQYAKANNPKIASEVGVVKMPAPSPAKMARRSWTATRSSFRGARERPGSVQLHCLGDHQRVSARPSSPTRSRTFRS